MNDHTSESRRRLLLAGACGAAVGGAQAAEPDERAERLRSLLTDRRSLRLVRDREQVEATYWTANNGYDRDQYLNICWLLRDVQADRVFPINHQLLDVLSGLLTWLAQKGSNAPLRIHSGYRSPKTNFKTEGAALNSRHLVGRAVDISVDGVPNVRLAGMATLLGRGGTGLYPGRNFVHVDTGDERIWVTPPRRKPA